VSKVKLRKVNIFGTNYSAHRRRRRVTLSWLIAAVV